MNFANLIGQIIDGKYKIERQLGKGGMGTVYLATHVGTERPVAVKVIVQQFMQRPEFVERFRREARAAGRLRHPNVVDVTDFGIAEVSGGRTAYLVMEYLDGCTLGEILEEEKQLPLSWSLDILEQVCSAVHEAHEQGIIHRDLKPDNIWLEPNQRGGYTVKVLDFGIAKLEEQAGEMLAGGLQISSNPTHAARFAETVLENAQTLPDNRNSTVIGESGAMTILPEAGTLIQKDNSFFEKGTAIMTGDEVDSEDETAIFPDKQTQLIENDEGTRLIAGADVTDKSSKADLATSALTRVGAVLGTPLYMSPEQCRGEKLSPRSDIYSLGVIAYQMLSGKTPFEGDFKSVMDAHKEIEPPALEAKKIPKKVKRVVHAALAKNVTARPPTAEALASQFRAHSEGIGSLLTRSFVIYSERLPIFLKMAFLTSIPVLILVFSTAIFNFLRAVEVIEDNLLTMMISGFFGLITYFTQIFTVTFITAMTVWIVAQVLAVPLRPIELRKAFQKVRERWKPLLLNVTASTLLSILGLILCVIPGIWLSVRFMLIAPSIMMEGVRGRQAFRRSAELVKRSYRTVLAAALLAYFVPIVLGIIIGLAARGLVEGNMNTNKPAVMIAREEQKSPNINFQVGGVDVQTDKNQISDEEKAWRKSKALRKSLTGAIFEVLWSPLAVIISSFTSIITALIYFKTRQAGGESMQELLDQFEDAERPKAKWQQRVEDRLIQSGRITSKT